MRIRRVVVIAIITIGLISQIKSQEHVLEDVVGIEKVDKLVESLDYSKSKNAWVPRDAQTNNEEEVSQNSGIWIISKLMFYILIALVVIVLIFIISQIFSEIQENPTVTQIADKEIQEIEITDIHQLNLDLMLTTALSSEDYKMAIRTQFLILLRLMSTNGIIQWSLEKTNRDYLRETRSQPFNHNFRYVAGLFDQTWYGDINVDKGTYTEMALYSENLSSFINKIVEQK